MNIGLLMIRDENDILNDTLAINARLVDVFYVLDGSKDAFIARDICAKFDNCARVFRDSGVVTDSSRQLLLDAAREDHGDNHWYLLLHGDELWTFDPSDVVDNHPAAEGFEFRLPFAFPRRWDSQRTAFEQLTEFAGPGWPEFRMFRDQPGVHYVAGRHHECKPEGVDIVFRVEGHWILHYPYRSPQHQRERARTRRVWSPENYQHISAGGVFWNDDMLADLRSEHYTWIAHFEPVAA